VTKKNFKFEPRINTKQKMDVGGFILPPTNTLTGLLYGFHHHTDHDAREYYFWRLCDELFNNPDLVAEPLMVRHPWAEEMIRAVIENKYVAIGGAASSGKSHTLAAWGVLSWLAQPQDTLVLLTSTTLREARKRIWGSVISLLLPLEGLAPIRIRDSIGNACYVTPSGNLVEKAGLSLIASERSRTKDAIGKLIGIKQKKVILIGDELSELSESILQASLSNLSKNPSFSLVALSNPSSRFDAFGVFSEPKGGWDSVDTNSADTWETKWGGTYIRFDAERSPNVLADEVLYPWLPTTEKLNEDKALLGPNSRGYMRMVRAVFFDSDEAEGVYTEAELARSGSMRQVQWKGSPVNICGFDPAFTNSGDRCMLVFGKVGYDTTGQYVCELGEAVQINDDATNKSTPRSYQVVQQVRRECEKRGVLPLDLAVDSTGAGAPLCDLLAGEWSDDILRVSFGGKATDKKVSANSKKVAHELYTNRVTELWFVGKELIRTKQLFGVSTDLAQEITGRKYDMIKGSSLRMKMESKVEFKSRFGKSPDLADAAFLCLDVARQRHGLVAVEPPSSSPSGKPRPHKSMKRLTGILANNPL
tara:strand:+ start:9815 stop:11581 length:1767 start_codon:yes stop_codon:yes gene_type:complete